MTEPKIDERGGPVKYHTIRTGTGKNRKYLRVAVVRKKGPNGGKTVGGPVRTPKGT